mmetsp:Transcript_14057/g.18413  ORF Transcript_14057/g.18413 Transcript_14057/m.18413 type:complete len:313 (+) Transcript_14057:43-981(+)
MSSEVSSLRTKDFRIIDHNHGKARVRVMKVDRSNDQHRVFEYNVHTKVFCPKYELVFSAEDNTDLVATDSQRNTVYCVAKRTKADSPEQFGVDICSHFMKEYGFLSGSEVTVEMTEWKRSEVDGEPHDHAFEKASSEMQVATVKSERCEDGTSFKSSVTSMIKSMTILKTTKSGFEGYLKDKYTLLPETTERCLATELDCTWTYDSSVNHDEQCIDYRAQRSRVRELLLKGIFGPSKGGVYSASLQATIYDAACIVLADEFLGSIWSIKLFTPNLHYLPMKNLEMLGETFEDDIFIPTSEPSGTITCTVCRE